MYFENLSSLSGCEQCSLVKQVFKVGSRKARGGAGDGREVDVGGKRLAARVHLEDSLAPLYVGIVDRDLTVEAARAQQRLIEYVGAVGRSDDDYALVRAEAVHFDKQLVERLLALVVPAAETCSALTADGVDLVDEDYRGRLALGLTEQVAHTRRADADEHFDKIRA